MMFRSHMVNANLGHQGSDGLGVTITGNLITGEAHRGTGGHMPDTMPISLACDAAIGTIWHLVWCSAKENMKSFASFVKKSVTPDRPVDKWSPLVDYWLWLSCCASP